jgi:hypothetical protein
MNKFRLTFLIFFLITTISYSQKRPPEPEENKYSLIEVMMAAGISAGISPAQNNTSAGNGKFIDLSSTYYFSDLGIGISLGNFSNPIKKEKLDNIITTYPIKFNSENWKTNYYGIGPNYRINIGKIKTVIFGRAGLMYVKPISLKGNFIPEDPQSPINSVAVYNFSKKETSIIGFYNVGVRFGYKLNPNFGLYISASYLSSFSDKIIAQDGRKQFTDINNDGIITETDIVSEEGTLVDFQYTEKKIHPQVFNFGIGLSYSFRIEK